MRIAIREQLGLLILLSSLIGLAVVAIATWVTNHSLVLSVRAAQLALTASLKASQIESNLNLMQTSANFITTRVLIQNALMRYNNVGNNTEANWSNAQSDMQDAIGGEGSVGQALLLQSMLYASNSSGPQSTYGVLNATGSTINNTILLPYTCPDGSPVYLGDGHCENLGYPPILYPNLTVSEAAYNATSNVPVASFDGDTLTSGSTLLIGPYQINNTFSLVSMTMPVINNTSAADVLGWLTVVLDARLVKSAIASTTGLGTSGETLLVGPITETNTFASGTLTKRDDASGDYLVKYVFPLNDSDVQRHPGQTYGEADPSFEASSYPAVAAAFSDNSSDADGALISTHNEANRRVAVGYSLVNVDFVDWAVLVEQSRREVWQPIDHLRDILLACVFATAVFMALLAFPLAHLFSLPIRRLREATTKSMEPPGMEASRSSLDSFDSHRDGELRDLTEDGADGEAAILARKEGFNPVKQWRRKRNQKLETRREARRKQAFKIPGKVKEQKHWVKDELSDLTTTFNEMSDELMMQYTKLEERVQQRTAELELSKKAAEAANESKTLFIANISHELKTPLNGIMGMCAVCMQEDDPIRLKRSLGIIYKSGDLLLNLLTDLLTFSKNQVGQHLSLDEKEFRLRDVRTQILAIFDKQAKEGQIDLRVDLGGMSRGDQDSGSPERSIYGPAGTGRIKDMVLWGDTHRILQVLINLTSNALKFTPPGGSVVVTIRCLPDLVEVGSRKGSLSSRQSKPNSSRHKNSDATISGSRMDTANAINIKDKPHAIVTTHERAPSPPPHGTYYNFEFEVTDSGPGIPENMQQRIFEPFMQGDLGLSKKYGGTGLGLSICSQLASLMRGTVGVRSVVGQGSTFTMKIPLRHLLSRADSTASSSIDLNEGLIRSTSVDDGERTPARHSRHLLDDTPATRGTTGDSSASSNVAMSSDSQPRLVGLSQPFFAASQPMESPSSQPAAMEKITAEATRGGKIRVLVAEDNKVNQEVVLRMLKLEDIYDVTVAKDGQEALDMVKESMRVDGDTEAKPFNLIFMDVQMPNVDGLQSTRLIREIGYQAPIVALTAFAEESNIKDCLDSGMNYFLSKPIRRPQLKKVLKEYCAPIPEENEEMTPPELTARRGSKSQTTTIVMVNRPSSEAQRPSSQGDPPQSRASMAVDDRPVSPLSTT